MSTIASETMNSESRETFGLWVKAPTAPTGSSVQVGICVSGGNVDDDDWVTAAWEGDYDSTRKEAKVRTPSFGTSDKSPDIAVEEHGLYDVKVRTGGAGGPVATVLVLKVT